MTYRYLLTTSELLDALKVPRELVPSDKRVPIFLWIGGVGFCVALACAGALRFKWFEKETLQIIALVSWALVMVAVFAVMVLGIIRNISLFRNPAKDMAVQIDAEAEMDLQFMRKVGQIPASILLERHQYLEAHLARRDKWLDVVRLMAIIVPVVMLLSIELLGKENISSWLGFGMYSLLFGVALGAILIRSGSVELQRLSFVLKKTGERRQADQARRRRKRLK